MNILSGYIGILDITKKYHLCNQVSPDFPVGRAMKQRTTIILERNEREFINPSLSKAKPESNHSSQDA